MLGRKDGAAVLIRENGGIQRPDTAGDGNDLLLIHADERMEDWHMDDRAGHGHGVHGLGRDLTEIFAGDKALRAVVAADGLCNAHHKAAHDDREVFLTAVVADGLLNFGKADDINGHAAAELRHDVRQLQNLFLGKLRGVRVREEVDAFDLHAALGDHVTRDRGIDTAGEQDCRASASARRQAACAGDGRAVDVGRRLADLDIDGIVGVVDVDQNVREFLCQPSADLLRDLDGVQREALIRALGFDLEAFGCGQLIAQILADGVKHGVEIFSAGTAAAHLGHAEDRAAGLPRAVQIAVLGQRLDIERRLDDIDLEFAEFRHAAAGDGLELILKDAAVLSLQDDLAQFQ